MSMEGDELQSRFLVSVVDPTNVWGLISEILLNRLPFRHVHLKNKFGKLIPVSELQIQYISSEDALLKRRRAFAHQPVAWFRNPYAQLVLVSGESVDEYKLHVRDGLRRLLDHPGDGIGGLTESIVVYVKPSSVDAYSKGPGKVFQALRSDFSSRRKDRCIRVDFSGGMVSGVDDLERMLRDAIKTTFEARAAAYDEQVRQLMVARQSPGWQFSTLFLVKDSLAVMLESAHMYEDGLREYSELEACYLEALAMGGPLSQQPFGGDRPGDDVAQLLSATWRETRHAVRETGMVSQFRFRQFLFACQARILGKLERHIEVAERGLKFVNTLGELLASAGLPSTLREAWAFSACLALAVQLARTAPVSSAGMQPALMPTISDASNQHSSAREAADRTSRPIVRSQSVGALGDSPSPEPGPRQGSASPSKRSMPSAEAVRSHEDGESTLRQEASRNQRTITPPQRPSRLDPASERGRTTNQGEGRANGPGRRGQPVSQPQKRPRTDWALGLSVAYDAELLEEAGQAAAVTVEAAAAGAMDPASRAFWCALGNLYAAARTKVMRLGHAAALRPDASESPMLQNGASPLGEPGRSADLSPVKASLEAPQQVDQAVPDGRPVADLTTRLSRFAPFEAAIGFRDRRLRSRSDAADSARSLASANLAKSTAQLQADSFTSTEKSAQSDSAASDTTDALPLSSAAKTDFLSFPPAAMDKASIRSRSHGEEVSRLVDQSSDADIQGEERRKSETDMAQSLRDLPINTSLNANDLRHVEREIETSSESSMPSTPVMGNGRHGRSSLQDGGKPWSWLTEERLVTALSAKYEYEELWLELSRCAAMCYKRGGRRRNAALLRLEVAEALAGRGAVRASVSLLAALAQDALVEGWLSLAAGLLYRLLSVSAPLETADKAHVCVRLLSLSDAMGPSSEQVATQEELTHAATALSQAAPLPGPLADLRLQNGDMDALRMLWAQPVQGEYARFFGQSRSPGRPVLAPSRPCSRQQKEHTSEPDAPNRFGTLEETAGAPAAPAMLEGSSSTAEELCRKEGSGRKDVLEQQHASQNDASSEHDTIPGNQPSVTPSRTENGSSSTTEEPARKEAQGTTGRPGQQRADREPGLARAAEPQLPSAALHFEGCLGDMLCVHVDLVSIMPKAVPLQQITLVMAIMQESSGAPSAVTSPSGTARSGSPFDAALDGRALLESRLRSTPRTYREHSEFGSTPHSQRRAVSWREVEELECPLAASQGSDMSVVLQPGPNRLAFQVTVLRQGLYSLKHVLARLGRLSLRLRVALPGDEGPPVELLTAPPLTGVLSEAQALAQPAIGDVDASGRLREEPVLLNAHACQPRLRLAAIAQKGRLVAGHQNWLGLALQPLHDELLGLRVHAAAAPSAAKDPWAASGTGAGNAQDSRCMRQAGSTIGSKTWTTLDSLELVDQPAALVPLQALPQQSEKALTGTASALEGDSTPTMPGGSAQQMRIVARAGSSASDHREGEWVSVQPAHGAAEALPQWTARHPSVLWLCVRPGAVELPTEIVRLVGHMETRALQQSGESAQQSMVVELDVNVEYTAGCQRSHAARMAVPVIEPMRVSISAKELPDRRIVLQAKVASMLSRPASITQAITSAPAGYEVLELPHELQSLYPLQVPPGATVAVLLFLAPQHKVNRSARSLPSTLVLDFTVDDLAERTGAVEPTSQDQSWPEAPLPAPPPMPPQAAQGAEEGSMRSHSLMHRFVLEAAEVAETPRTTVAMQLLGPHTVRVGEQATFCWRLERVGAAEGAMLVGYEAFADADAWSPAGARSSYVALHASPGSVATVEAAWTPLLVGDLSVPQLRLCDVGQKDVFDDAGLLFIACLPAG